MDAGDTSKLCGLFEGKKEFKNIQYDFPPKQIAKSRGREFYIKQRERREHETMNDEGKMDNERGMKPIL